MTFIPALVLVKMVTVVTILFFFFSELDNLQIEGRQYSNVWR